MCLVPSPPPRCYPHVFMHRYTASQKFFRHPIFQRFPGVCVEDDGRQDAIVNAIN